jgi:hypothetical protein
MPSKTHLVLIPSYNPRRPEGVETVRRASAVAETNAILRSVWEETPMEPPPA